MKAISNKQNYLKTQGLRREAVSPLSLEACERSLDIHSFVGILHKGIQEMLDQLVFMVPANPEAS